MNQIAKKIIVTNHSDQTESFARKLGSQLQGGEVIELIGDLGAGKTTFVRGLAQGTQSTDRVSSPTFTISNVYKGRIDVHHYDLYRLHNDKLIIEELTELLDDNKVVVLEWPQEVKQILPKSRISIELKPTNENTREITIHIPKQFNYLDVA